MLVVLHIALDLVRDWFWLPFRKVSLVKSNNQ